MLADGITHNVAAGDRVARFTAIGDVLYGMAIIMAVATFVAVRGLWRGVQEEPEAAGTGSV